MPREKYTAEEKQDFILEFRDSGLTKKSFCKTKGLTYSSFNWWLTKYTRDGFVGLEPAHDWQRYSAETKQKVVEAFLNGEGSQVELAIKYGLRSVSQLRDWVLKYNGGTKLTYKRDEPMKHGRKTTWEERIEIADYAIANNHDYGKTIEKYNVSYQQVYSWVRKLERDGQESLRDKRGRKKVDEELTEIEKLKLENKRLRAELEHKGAAEELLKKFLDTHRKKR